VQRSFPVGRMPKVTLLQVSPSSAALSHASPLSITPFPHVALTESLDFWDESSCDPHAPSRDAALSAAKPASLIRIFSSVRRPEPCSKQRLTS
jgi:hypothetical protein